MTQQQKEALFHVLATPFSSDKAEAAYRRMYYATKNLVLCRFDTHSALNAHMLANQPDKPPKFITLIKGGGPHVGLGVPRLLGAVDYQMKAAAFFERNKWRHGPISDCFVRVRLLLGLLEAGYEFSGWGNIEYDVAINCGHHFKCGNVVYYCGRNINTENTDG
jgi:hypothetical protein